MITINRIAAISALTITTLSLGTATSTAATIHPHASATPIAAEKVLPVRHHESTVTIPAVRHDANVSLLSPVPALRPPVPGNNTAAVRRTVQPELAPTAPMIAQSIDTTADFNSALGTAATQFGLATGVGTLAGGVIGGIAGCVLGATVGAATLPVFFLASGPAGCLVGAALGATLGPVIGAAILGIPTGVASAVQMYNTLNTPPAT
ncbi:glycine zipper domain-containing protein [Nocardia sp. NBC_00511]|uniref:glycine zipper domain-containing protein n=1 Tax=Nocardia sp. NBC_00511 TaxID=2903591 RepID=UPI0030E2E4DE